MARQCAADEKCGVNGIHTGAQDARGIAAKTGDARGQCSFVGSDQFDRPVTALNERRSLPIN